MVKSGLVLLVLMGLVALASADNMIVPAESTMKLIREIPNAKLLAVSADSPYSPVRLRVAHLFGSAYEMGYAHGRLFAKEITTFMQKSLPDHIVKMVQELDLHNLPEWLQKLIKEAAPDVAPVVVRLALEYVLDLQTPFLEKSNVQPLVEMDAVGDGVCAELGSSCDVKAMRRMIRATNLFPDLVRMACSVIGSWGPANAPGHDGLIQSRLLDFGAGPFPNASVIIVQHPNEGYPFFSLSFPGFVGVVTGMSSQIALSEKVWMVTGKGLQDGTYEGEAVVMYMRRALQFADNIDTAVDMARQTNRTWAVWLGAGQKQASDKTGKPFTIMAYRHEDLNAYDDENIGKVTGGPYFKNIAYVDKHPQPSRADDLPRLLKSQYGNITAEWVVKNIPKNTRSGDVHIAIYDFMRSRIFISTGVTDENGEYPKTGGGQAYDRTFLSFNTTRLWAEKPPAL